MGRSIMGWIVSWTCGPWNCERKHFYCFKPPRWWCFVIVASGNLHTARLRLQCRDLGLLSCWGWENFGHSAFWSASYTACGWLNRALGTDQDHPGDSKCRMHTCSGPTLCPALGYNLSFPRGARGNQGVEACSGLLHGHRTTKGKESSWVSRASSGFSPEEMSQRTQALGALNLPEKGSYFLV